MFIKSYLQSPIYLGSPSNTPVWPCAIGVNIKQLNNCNFQCGRLQFIYTLYRLIWALWWVAFIIYEIQGAIKLSRTTWITYLTKQGCLMLTISSVLQFVAAALYQKHGVEVNSSSKISVFCKTSWAFYELSSPLAVAICVLYWLAEHRKSYWLVSSITQTWRLFLN